MPKKSSTPKPDETTGVIHLRVDRDIRTGLAAIAAETGKSSNDLATGAIAEFIEVVKLAGELESGLRTGKTHASDFLDLLGVFWVHRFAAMGIAGQGMQAAWRLHLADQQATRAEVQASRKESAERRKGKP